MRHSFLGLSRTTSAGSLDALLHVFDEGWRRGEEGGLAKFWANVRGHRPLTDLSALIKVDLRRRFDAGERPTAQEYLTQFPELVADGDRVLSLVYEEFCLLDEHQAQPSVTDFCQRYERWKDSIASQLGYHHQFSQIAGVDSAPVLYPVVGERFASYQLQSVLGQGGTAQVYLATDEELGDRQVVLKLTPTLGLEPSILASLEHRNIVPIHSVVRAPESSLQGICMPYRPGITLEQLLVHLLASGPPRRSRIIWDLLGVNNLDRDELDRAWRDFPSDGTYTEGVAWLGREMAQALHYLHGRGVYHRDIKPANILLSTRGGPLLIDFNLAHSPHTPEQARAAMSGGTLPYMAPEQLQAFLDPDAWEGVGPAADIYALGLVLRELVTGVRPHLPTPGLPLDRAIADLHERRCDYAASARDQRPDLPPSLDAIICRCLALRPADRYANAQQLAEDLRQFLQRKPLVWAANPSPLERSLNWIYRQRQTVNVLTLVGLVLVTGLLINYVRPHSGSPTVGDLAEVRKRSIYDAPSDPRFQEVLQQLGSGQRSGLAAAQAGLKRLAAAHPDSAWPVVYQIEVERRLGDDQNSRNRCDFLRQTAEAKGDAKEVALDWLEQSVDRFYPSYLLGRIGLDQNQFLEARSYLREAEQYDGTSQAVKKDLARVAMHLREPQEAIRLYEEVIHLADESHRPGNLDDVRNALIQVALDYATNFRADSADRAGRQQVVACLNLAEKHLDLLNTEPESLARSGPRVVLPYLVEQSRGLLELNRAYLLHFDDSAATTLGRFREAREHLNRAHDLVPGRLVPGEVAKTPDPLLYLKKLHQILDQRLELCGFKVDSVPSSR